MASHRETATALAGNLTRLMEHQALSQAELARKSGVAQSTLSVLLDTGDAIKNNPRAETIDKLSEYFRVPGWLLLVPNLPLELLLSDRLATLIANYRDAGTMGRDSIERIAASEVRYAAATATTAAARAASGT